MFKTTLIAILFTLVAIFVGGYVYEIMLGKGSPAVVEEQATTPASE